MLSRKGFTLMEMIVVLIIIGVIVAITFPNFTTPTQQALAQAAKNNLMAIYSAQLNYSNNHGRYYTSGVNPSDVANINTSLSLNITDNTYSYACDNSDVSGFACWATNNATNPTMIQIKNAPIVLTGAPLNPWCTGPYCP